MTVQKIFLVANLNGIESAFKSIQGFPLENANKLK
jgi:hypothetical protein